MFDELPGQPRVKICCGPRCGVTPGHRALYDAVERAATAGGVATRPTLCQGLCGDGVTVVLPNGERCKMRDVRDATVLGVAAATTDMAPATSGAQNSDEGSANAMATVKVLIPTPLRKFTGDQDTVTVENADTIGGLLQSLTAAHSGLRQPLIDENGNPRRFVNLYLNGEDVRFLQNADTAVKDGDEVSIVPAIAGGAR